MKTHVKSSTCNTKNTGTRETKHRASEKKWEKLHAYCLALLFPILFSLPITEATRAVPRNIIISLYYPPKIENPYNSHIKC